jgi:5-methyltetrahydrofolate--homocysteine methyltransferase
MRSPGAVEGATPAGAGALGATRFSGLDPFIVGPDTGFVVVGERTNVTGSARFRRLIEANDFQGAVAVALEQVRGAPTCSTSTWTPTCSMPSRR